MKPVGRGASLHIGEPVLVFCTAHQHTHMCCVALCYSFYRIRHINALLTLRERRKCVPVCINKISDDTRDMFSGAHVCACAVWCVRDGKFAA